MNQQWHTQGLFDGSCAGGIYRLLAPVSEVTAALTAAGWHAAHVETADTKQAFLTALGDALEFPDYYGSNLDAAWDCLTDLEHPTAVVWTSWHELAIDHPKDWADILSLLQDRTEQDPAFAVVLG